MQLVGPVEREILKEHAIEADQQERGGGHLHGPHQFGRDMYRESFAGADIEPRLEDRTHTAHGHFLRNHPQRDAMNAVIADVPQGERKVQVQHHRRPT